jgi:hypothetical protein
MNKKKYLTRDDLNRIDCACESVEDRKIVSELAETGKRIMDLKIRDNEKLYQGMCDLKLNLLKILDELDSTEAIEKLKTDIKSCRDIEELIELANSTLKFVDALN